MKKPPTAREIEPAFLTSDEVVSDFGGSSCGNEPASCGSEPASCGNEPDSNESNSTAVSWIESPVGLLLAGANSEGLCLLEFTEPLTKEARLAKLRKRFSAIVVGGNRHTEKLKEELADYFAGTLDRFSPPPRFCC